LGTKLICSDPVLPATSKNARMRIGHSRYTIHGVRMAVAYDQWSKREMA